MQKYFMTVLWIVLTTITIGCSKIALIIAGVEKPKPETTESLRGFLNTIGCVPKEFYITKDSIALIQLFKMQSSFPDAEFFDSNGFFLPYNENTENTCNAGIDRFIDQLAANKIMSTSLDNIQARLNCIINAHTHEKISFSELPRSDYYVIFYFTKWIGKKVNKEHLTSWVNQISLLDEGNYKMTYLIVSADYMSDWGVSPPKLKFKN